MTALRVKLFCLVMLVASLSIAPLTQAQQRTELAVGGGLIIFIPYGHAEVRHYMSDNVSMAAFASATRATGTIKLNQSESQYSITMTNIGTELRYHLAPHSVIDPHIGVGGGLLVSTSNNDKSSSPWFWGNIGLTLQAGSHARVDLEINPVLNVPQSSMSGIKAVPVARLRWVF